MGYAHRNFLVSDTRSRITIRQETTDQPRAIIIRINLTITGVLDGSMAMKNPIAARGSIQ